MSAEDLFRTTFRVPSNRNSTQELQGEPGFVTSPIRWHAQSSPRYNHYNQALLNYDEKQDDYTNVDLPLTATSYLDTSYINEFPADFPSVYQSFLPPGQPFPTIFSQSRNLGTATSSPARGIGQGNELFTVDTSFDFGANRFSNLEPTPTYRLCCRQSPAHARMCGFGDKDRRPIDPPPILDCQAFDKYGSPIPGSTCDPLLVVHVTLWNEDRTEDRNMIVSETKSKKRKYRPSEDQPSFTDCKMSRVLMGSLVASPVVLKDDLDKEGTFFVFPDLSVRTEGCYRLRFSLFRMNLESMLLPGSSCQSLCDATSEPFTVFSAKRFPGMLKSTDLTKAFARQGLKLQIRNTGACTDGSLAKSEDDEGEAEA